ncbi:MAG: hypothetical protein BWX71_02665 [Deltaproteobacteria bacterium ADurb.Bin072]|nr:MAG: hypothetical protein BWX71_02665 [Deltaproteobacteria bacterium ADurb.Bin072]
MVPCQLERIPSHGAPGVPGVLDVVPGVLDVVHGQGRSCRVAAEAHEGQVIREEVAVLIIEGEHPVRLGRSHGAGRPPDLPEVADLPGIPVLDLSDVVVGYDPIRYGRINGRKVHAVGGDNGALAYAVALPADGDGGEWCVEAFLLADSFPLERAGVDPGIVQLPEALLEPDIQDIADHLGAHDLVRCRAVHPAVGGPGRVGPRCAAPASPWPEGGFLGRRQKDDVTVILEDELAGIDLVRGPARVIDRQGSECGPVPGPDLVNPVRYVNLVVGRAAAMKEVVIQAGPGVLLGHVVEQARCRVVLAHSLCVEGQEISAGRRVVLPDPHDRKARVEVIIGRDVGGDLRGSMKGHGEGPCLVHDGSDATCIAGQRPVAVVGEFLHAVGELDVPDRHVCQGAGESDLALIACPH